MSVIRKEIKLKKKDIKILEALSRKAFPEYDFDFSWMKETGMHCGGYIKYWNAKMKTASFIHWYEFVVTKLVYQGKDMRFYDLSSLMNDLYGSKPFLNLSNYI